MKRRLFAPAALAAGLLTAQGIACVHVYRSNLQLFNATQALLAGGYLAVPNKWVAQGLTSPTTALAGGLFFTLSIGSGLSMLALISVWLWDRLSRRNPKVAIAIGCLWIATLLLVNNNGWNPAASAYLIAVPLAAGSCGLSLLPEKARHVRGSTALWPISAALVLALAWSTVLDRHVFTNLRDNLLLSNRVGETITKAYYTYTLYPAEAFKSLRQKQLRTCRLARTVGPDQADSVERLLRARDYLNVSDGAPTDLIVGQDSRDGQLVLQTNGKALVRRSLKDFLRDPGGALNAFSEKQDRHVVFRKATLICLLLGLPLVLFAFLFSGSTALLSLVLPQSFSDALAAGVCIAVGIGMLVPVYKGQQAMASLDRSALSLESASTVERIAVLKKIYLERLDIAQQAGARAIERSPNIAERYWLARSLVHAEDPLTNQRLLDLSHDPVPIVACQALWALGQRKDHAVIPRIIERIQTSSHWYLQMYGYRALKALGWVQPRSPQN